MISLNKKQIIPIGCSCINQFQIQFHFGQDNTTSTLFDWNITTPRSTVEILQSIRSGEIYSLFYNAAAYELENGYLKNKNFEGLYFWHENGKNILDNLDGIEFSNFSAKLMHIIDNTFQSRENTYLVWSNIQPNLKSAVEGLNTTWGLYRLTAEVYRDIKIEAAKVFINPNFIFTGRIEDIDTELLGEKDVHIFDISRSGDYQGSKNLYQNIFLEATNDCVIPPKFHLPKIL